MTMSSTAPVIERDNGAFIIARTFDAPRDVVFKAFTEPERMKRWWGPKGFTVIASTMDLRPGGTYHYGLKAPDGSTMWGKFVYSEIVAPERLVFINSFSDENGGITRHPMSPTWPLEMLSTFSFTEEHGRTTFTVKWTPLDPSPEERATFDGAQDNMRQGWSGTMDQLAAYLAAI
ncbi:MAG TPA: SRPBCC domain-containing protein [Xanthobacteraceae bacterium]|nr:SRPBCC domain-containing protein [Xanthobacteraceae bacterium]